MNYLSQYLSQHEWSDFLRFYKLSESKDSLIVLSCLSDMADKTRKVVNSFPNASYKDKLSKVIKSIDSSVINAVKRKKQNEKFFKDKLFIAMISLR